MSTSRSYDLSTSMRIAVRAIADGKGNEVHGRTLKSLRDRLLVEQNSRELTEAGKEAHAEIMSSGDGPEDLKAMFAPIFGGGRRGRR